MSSYSVSCTETNDWKLVINILEEQFGAKVRDVAIIMCRKERITLKDIHRQAKLKKFKISESDVRNVLLILLQHNCLDVLMPTVEEYRRTHPDIIYWYKLKPEEIRIRIRYPKFVQRAKELYGDIGAWIIKEVAIHGRLKVDQIVKDATVRFLSNEVGIGDEKHKLINLDENGDLDVSEVKFKQVLEDVRDVFKRMITARYIVRVNPYDLSKPVVISNPIELQKKSKLNLKSREISPIKSGEEAPSMRFGVREEEIVDEEDKDDLPFEIRMAMQAMKAAKTENNDEFISEQQREVTKQGYEVDGFVVPDNETEEESRKRKIPHSEEKERKRSRPTSRGRRRGGGASRGLVKKVKDEEDQPPANDTSIMDVDSGNDDKDKKEKKKATDVNADVLWKIGYDQFHRDMRHVLLIKFTKDRTNNIGEQIMKAVITMANPHEKACNEEKTRDFALRDIYNAVNDNYDKIEMETFKMYIDCMKNDDMISKSIGAVTDQDRYAVNMGNIIRFLQEKTLHNILKNRYDLLSARICAVLLEQKYLDQGKISELAMVSLKEAREKLHKLYKDEFVTFQEIPKKADHNPAHTTYLWTMKLEHVYEIIGLDFDKAILNLRLRRKFEIEENKDLVLSYNEGHSGDDNINSKGKELYDRLQRLDLAILRLDTSAALFSLF